MTLTKPMLITLALLVAAPVMAQTAPADPRARMLAEVQALTLPTLDTNGDGGVSLDEWRAHVTARAGAIQADVLGARVDALFQGDADGDGMLTRAEAQARMAALGAERRAAFDGARHEGRRHGHGRHGGAGLFLGGADDDGIVRAFQRIDRDGDGRLDATELARAVDRMTDRMARRG